MQQKENSSVGSGAQARKEGLALSDKYVAPQFENQKLKQRFRKLCDALSFWKWSALEAQERKHDL